MEKLIAKLNDLIALDIDATHAYAAAIKRMSSSLLQDKLRLFQRDHEQHVLDLANCVTRYGGQARKRADLKGFFIEGFTAVTSMMGDEAALVAMRGNETLTNRTYQNALNESWSEEVRTVIEKNYADEQRHLAWILEALKTRPWEAGQQQPHP